MNGLIKWYKNNWKINVHKIINYSKVMQAYIKLRFVQILINLESIIAKSRSYSSLN
jgi:hypothetical protein